MYGNKVIGVTDIANHYKISRQWAYCLLRKNNAPKPVLVHPVMLYDRNQVMEYFEHHKSAAAL